eukprot:scaffold288_cov108-Isochrysis_galbana.AAC.9
MCALRPIARSSWCASRLESACTNAMSTCSRLAQLRGARMLCTMATKAEPKRESCIASGQSWMRAEWWGT